jgi:hypothetical protein
MSSYGQQHHHGVTKNIVEGIGGVIIGAAAVLLLARVFKHNKPAVATTAMPAAVEKATTAAAKATAKPLSAKPARAKAVPKPTPRPAVAQPETVAAPVAVKRASRVRAKAAVNKAAPTQPESNES